MIKRTLLTIVLLAVCAGGFAAPAPAQRPPVRVETSNPQFAGEIQLPVGKSRILRVDQPITDILVGNPEVADVLALSDRSVYVVGKRIGSTNVAIYGDDRRLVAVVDATVTPDLPALRQRLSEVLPGERIEVRAANDTIVLSGMASNAERLKSALDVAESFAPGKVKNVLSLAGSQQVMLAVRFAEIQRSVSKQIGFNTRARFGSGNDVLAIATGVVPALAPFAAIQGVLNWGNVSINVLLDALEQKGVVKTLAEPNLIAMSGETASFLAGGEFPIPVGVDNDDDGSDITIEFKEFGVKLAFTPTVLGDAINLVVQPEVSAIDPNTSITLSDIVIPGLTTRRATTTVELRHGESFAIAGLIQSNFSDTVEAFPGIGNIPVLGTLFRSTSFQREESELVIIVTPYLVRPALAGQLRLPTDTFVPPSEVDLFLHGRVDPTIGLPGEATAPGASMPPGAGLAGSVGYVSW